MMIATDVVRKDHDLIEKGKWHDRYHHCPPRSLRGACDSYGDTRERIKVHEITIFTSECCYDERRRKRDRDDPARVTPPAVQNHPKAAAARHQKCECVRAGNSNL